MSTITQYLYKWHLPNGGETTTNNLDIYRNILPGNQIAIKLGIKAPPGTQVKINNSTFTVGASGVLTVNKPGYKITYLQFIKPQIIKKNETETENTLKEAIDIMSTALSTFLEDSNATIVGITQSTSPVPESQEQLEVVFDPEYIINNPSISYSIYSNFLNKFIEGYQLYSLGYKGIYEISGEGDLQNILIDLELE